MHASTRLLVLPALLLASAAAANVRDVRGPAPATPEAPRTGAVLWVEPLALGASLTARDRDDRVLYIPVGLSVPRTERSAWTFELGLAQYQDGCRDRFMPHCYANGRMVRGLAGVSFSQKGQQRGLFVQPRVGVTVARQEEVVSDTAPGNPRSPAGTMVGTDVGFDVGYQLRWKHLYLATMVGVSAGPAFNAPGNSTGSSFLWDAFYNDPSRGTRVFYNVNLNLLRVGWGL